MKICSLSETRPEQTEAGQPRWARSLWYESPDQWSYVARFEGDAVVVLSKSSEAHNLMPANDDSGAQLTIIIIMLLRVTIWGI
jgi:hypothetical protein